MIDPIEELRRRVASGKDAGLSEAGVAVQLGITRQYLNDVLKSKRGIGPQLLDGLGLEARYFRKRKKK